MSMRHAMAQAGLVPDDAGPEVTMAQRQRDRSNRGGRRGSDPGSGSTQGQGGYRYSGAFEGPYFRTDEQGNDCLLVQFVAKKDMNELAEQLHRGRLTTGQVRRFFNHCREIERRLKTDGESWDQVRASFEMLSSHAQYAKATDKIPPLFQEFIDVNVDRVTSSQDQSKAFLDGFLKHFEALVGYGAQHFREGT